MPEFTLSPESPLGDYSEHFDGAALAEVTDFALVSIAIPLDGREALATALHEQYGAEIPDAGETTTGHNGEPVFLGLGSDLLFAMLPGVQGLAVGEVATRLGPVAYVTEQSDNWAMVRISGPSTLAALERICPLDLAESAFPVGKVARTVMEHLGVIVLREEHDRFLLVSGRSSALSFLDAISVSIRNVT